MLQLPVVLITTLVISTVLWFAFILGLRSDNFTKEGKRRKPARGEKGSDRSSQIEYHNKAIYSDFTFFFKATLAIMGGTAFVLTSNELRSVEAAALLIQAGGWLQFASGLLFSVFIASHQKSKIERWEQTFTWRQILGWQETWMIISMLVISGTYAIAFVPRLIELFVTT